jgi:hypothetical protein
MYKSSESLELPEGAAKWTNAILAIKGAGKSWAAADFAEELVRHEVPILVIDPLGLWWGLRVGVDDDGKPDPNVAGLPVVIFGGHHSDMALPITTQTKGKREWEELDEEKLRVMVNSILESGISAILDVSGLSSTLKRRIVAQFVYEVMRQYESVGGYGVRHVFLEEAAEFAPQHLFVGDESHNSLGAVGKLVREGGNFNIGCTLITQRPAVLNKDCLTQCNCLFVLRILHKIDKDAVKTWVESMADPKDEAIGKWYDGLRELKNGEGWVWHPEQPNEIFQEIQFRKRTTLHATREYFQRIGKTPLKPQDVGDYLDKYKGIFAPTPTTRPPPIARNFEAPNVSHDGITHPITAEPGEVGGTEKVASKQDYPTQEHPDEEVRRCVVGPLKTEHLVAKQSGKRIDQFKGLNRVGIVDVVREHRLAVCIILGLLLSAWYLHI